MVYKLEIDNYELNRLKSAVLHQYKYDKQHMDTCLKTDNFDGADLASDSMSRDLKLLARLEKLKPVEEK